MLDLDFETALALPVMSLAANSPKVSAAAGSSLALNSVSRILATGLIPQAIPGFAEAHASGLNRTGNVGERMT